MTLTRTEIFKLLIQISLLFATQKILFLTFPVCLVVVYLVQMVYLRTSRQLRFLELESRSGVLATLQETVEGLSTIRSFGGEAQATTTQLHRLDEAHRPLYILLCLPQMICVFISSSTCTQF